MKVEYTKEKIFAILKAYIGCDSYTTENQFITFCNTKYPDLEDSVIKKFLVALEKEFWIMYDPDDRLYLRTTYNKEFQIACRLHDLLDSSPAYFRRVEEHRVDGLELSEEQNEAIALARSNSLSLVLGRTGSGRATLLRALIASDCSPHHFLICAPDAKAASDFSARIGRPVEALDIALERKIPEPRPARNWDLTEVIIVWDAQRMSLDQFITLLDRRKPRTRVVLFGDTNDLQSNTPGNLLPDLVEIGIPTVRLHNNYRAILYPTALVENIVSFDKISLSKDLCFDSSFMMVDVSDSTALETHVAQIYASNVAAGENAQVITPYGERHHPLAAYDLGLSLFKAVHGYEPDRPSVLVPHFVWDGSKVMVIEDDWPRNCRAGDIGILRCFRDGKFSDRRYCVEFDDARVAYWDPLKADFNVTLAHALTPQQARNNYFDVVIVPLSESHPIPSRREIYAAMVRARKKIIFVGNRNVLNKVLLRKDSRSSSLAIRFNDPRFAKK